MSFNVVDRYHCDPTGATDNAQPFAAMVNEIAGLAGGGPKPKPLPRLVFPEGQYGYTAMPNLAFNNLEIVGEGQVELHYDGVGDALTFDGNSMGAMGGGVFNMHVAGIRVVPTSVARDGIVIKSVHHSMFSRLKCYGAGAPRNGVPNKAISVYWNVCTEFDTMTVSPFDTATGLGGGGSMDCVGLWLDTVTQPANWQTTDCIFRNAVIEACRIGIQLQDAGGTLFSGGTAEGPSDTGIYVVKGGQNRSWGLWVEGNKNYDIWFGAGAKSNDFNLSHPSSLKVKNDAPLAGTIARGTVGIFGAPKTRTAKPLGGSVHIEIGHLLK